MFGAAPTVYHPYLNGRYTVSAGLLRLGEQPVEGRLETHTFAFDDTYPSYIGAKVEARARALHEGYAVAGLTPTLRAQALEFVAQTAAADSGGVLSWDGQALSNAALGWTGTLDLRRGTLERLRRFPAPLSGLVRNVEPLDALDFLAMNVQEDLSLLARHPESGQDHLAAVHVLLPEKWNPLDKVGRDFASVHAPVAGSGPMIATAPRLIEAIVSRGPFVRFVWGVTQSPLLAHHPNQPPEVGLPDDPDEGWLRIERQTLHGFPAQQGALFTIRPYLYRLPDLITTPTRAAALASALRSMTPEQRAYKGLAGSADRYLAWLDARSEGAKLGP